MEAGATRGPTEVGRHSVPSECVPAKPISGPRSKLHTTRSEQALTSFLSYCGVKTPYPFLDQRQPFFKYLYTQCIFDKNTHEKLLPINSSTFSLVGTKFLGVHELFLGRVSRDLRVLDIFLCSSSAYTFAGAKKKSLKCRVL